MTLLTIEQAAKATQFCRNTIKAAIKSGELRHGRFGRLVRIDEADLHAWIRRKIAVTMQSRDALEAEVAKMQLVEKKLSVHQ